MSQTVHGECRQDYGGDTDKPTWLYTNYQHIDDLDMFRTGPSENFGQHKLCKKYHTENKYTGQKTVKYQGSAHLKGSQHYPKAFGIAVRKMTEKNTTLSTKGNWL